MSVKSEAVARPRGTARRASTALAALLLLPCSCASRTQSDAESTRQATAPDDPDARYRIAETVGLTLATGRRFSTEVARSDDDRERGLMFRSHLGRDEAMIFVYPEPQPLAIWMKNCKFPIDVLFLDEAGAPDKLRVLHVLSAVPPCAADPCPNYSCPAPAQYFLELPAYTASAEGVRTGDVLTLDRPLR